MPVPTLEQNDEPIRAMLVGHSGAGKTGALLSLVEAGYKIRLIDMDNGRHILLNYIREKCPERLGQISYQSFRDKTKLTPAGPQISGQPKAFTGAVKALDKWDDDTNPAEWGMDTILVLDSLTSFGRAAYLWARAMSPMSKEKRQWYASAQEVVEDTIASLTDDEFKTNVLVLTHIDLIEDDKTEITRGFPTAIGKALGPKLPRYFNTVIMLESRGSGTNIKRELKTVSTTTMDLKTAAPMKVSPAYPIETGLADIFKALKAG